MERKPVISIITPCLNAEKYIRTTIESVINQTAFSSGKAELDYIIVDGGSNDKTLNIIHGIIDNHKLKKCVKIISEHDNGMYDALVKGIKYAYGDIFAYINADDYYNITAIDVVVSIMEKYPVKWLTGWAVSYNEYGHITYIKSQYIFRKRFFENGTYGTKLPHLQQESTFWRKELNRLIDLEKLKTLKYAGDYYLWIEFSKNNSLFIVETYLGGFRNREGQLSKQNKKYNEEKDKLTCRKMSFKDNILLLCEKIFFRINKMHTIFTCVKNENGEYVRLIYDGNLKEWVIFDRTLFFKKIKRRLLIKGERENA